MLRGALLLFLALATLAGPAWAAPPPAGVEVESTVLPVGGQNFPVRIVRVDLRLYRLKTGLAHGRVGSTQALAGIASDGGAAAAVNGSFFEAYHGRAVRNPEQNLVSGGNLVHRGGDTGCTLGVDADGDLRIDPVRFTLEGALDGQWGEARGWSAFWVNRQPAGAPAITVFTPAWGGETGIPGGTQAVVAGGVVSRIAHSSQRIPRDGFVVHFQVGVGPHAGAQARNAAYVRGIERRFSVGRRCEWRFRVKEGAPKAFWGRVEEAVGAGPRLVAGGRVDCHPLEEGFTESKIVRESAARSMVGVTADGHLLLVASEGTVQQMARLMHALGAVSAMNMDGGDSSGLWVRGEYLRRPGRDLSNALLVVPREVAVRPPRVGGEPAPPAPSELPPPPAPPSWSPGLGALPPVLDPPSAPSSLGRQPSSRSPHAFPRERRPQPSGRPPGLDPSLSRALGLFLKAFLFLGLASVGFGALGRRRRPDDTDDLRL